MRPMPCSDSCEAASRPDAAKFAPGQDRVQQQGILALPHAARSAVGQAADDVASEPPCVAWPRNSASPLFRKRHTKTPRIESLMTLLPMRKGQEHEPWPAGAGTIRSGVISPAGEFHLSGDEMSRIHW